MSWRNGSANTGSRETARFIRWSLIINGDAGCWCNGDLPVGWFYPPLCPGSVTWDRLPRCAVPDIGLRFLGRVKMVTAVCIDSRWCDDPPWPAVTLTLDTTVHTGCCQLRSVTSDSCLSHEQGPQTVTGALLSVVHQCVTVCLQRWDHGALVHRHSEDNWRHFCLVTEYHCCHRFNR